MKNLLMLVMLPAILFAEDIYLKSGITYKNVLILAEEDGKIIVQFNDKELGLAIESIDRIDKVKFDETQKSVIEGRVKSSIRSDRSSVDFKKRTYAFRSTTEYIYPHTGLIPLSLVAFALSYDYFKASSDVGNMINFYKKYGQNTEELELQKNRKSIIAAVLAIGGIVNMIYALTPVEISAGPDELSLSYQYNLR